MPVHGCTRKKGKQHNACVPPAGNLKMRNRWFLELLRKMFRVITIHDRRAQ
jgi:hypothetical protein